MTRLTLATAWAAFIAAFAFSVVVSSTQYPTKHGHIAHLLNGRQDQPESLQCEAPCEIDNTCGGSSSCTPAQKRNLEAIALQALNVNHANWYNESDSTVISSAFDFSALKRALDKRQFDRLDPNSRGRIGPKINDYVKTQNVPARASDRDPQFPGAPLGFTHENSQATVQYMSALGGDKIQWGTNGLHGCTMVAILSKRGAYMAHLWESYTTGLTDSLYGDLRTQWEQRVLYAMQGKEVSNPYNPPKREGDNKEFPYLVPFGDPVNWSLFNKDGDNTIAFFMTPLATGADEDSKDIKYPQKINLVVDLIKSNVPGVQVVITPYKRLDYTVPEDFAKIDKSALGMCLFQYDGVSDWRLFWEARVRDSLGNRYGDHNIEKRYR